MWRPVALALQLVPIVALLWRRTHPLMSVAVVWSVIAGLDIAAIAVGRDSPGLYTMALLIVFPRPRASSSEWSRTSHPLWMPTPNPNLVGFTVEHVFQPGYEFGDTFEVGLDVLPAEVSDFAGDT